MSQTQVPTNDLMCHRAFMVNILAATAEQLEDDLAYDLVIKMMEALVLSARKDTAEINPIPLKVMK